MNDLNSITQRLAACADLESALATVLDVAMGLHRADFGTIQIYEAGVLRTAAQRGFRKELVETLAAVSMAEGSACGRAMREGRPVSIFDVEADAAYAEFRPVAAAAGYRAVQSTPMVSSRGSFVGIVSTHFARPHAPSPDEMKELLAFCTPAADVIWHHTAPPRPGRTTVGP
jgi:GAF domain-containing protein